METEATKVNAARRGRADKKSSPRIPVAREAGGRKAPRRVALASLHAIQEAPTIATPKKTKASPKAPAPVGRRELEEALRRSELIVAKLRALLDRANLSGEDSAAQELTTMEGLAKSLPLSAGEEALLASSGLAAGHPGTPTALERSRVAFETLLQESFSLEGAANALGVTPARLRQRLGAEVRTLYGIKEGRSWRIPRFQFDGRGRLVRGIEKVLPCLPSDAHPLEVQAFFSLPHPDLVVGDEDERSVSPLQWLASGRSPEEVARLVADLDI